MALIYRATLTPTKPELLATWIPTQPWTNGLDTTGLEPVGAYRFDDPAGEVGIETHLVRAAAGAVFQVPLTYRSAPLDGGEAYLVATMEHSVLGTRWVYDGVGDPVWIAVTTAAIVDGAHQAELVVQSSDGSRAVHASTTLVTGTGGEGTGWSGLSVRRVIDPVPSDRPHLRGTWPGQDVPVPLVELAP